jgi:chromosome segregation protein
LKLRKIEIQGFKSFRARAGVAVGDGITAVVGPNGCGKSNIVDAIRWAMGVQSARALRGNEMSDVIFAGGGKHNASNFAEVTLTFENEAPAPPEQLGDEVNPVHALVGSATTLTVGRRLTRTGDSTYLVNGTSVRLKDIHEIFLGTGASVRGYSIVEQGQIDFLVNARPAERRTFVEELAGVTRYRFHRKETALKLDDTQQNLDRVEDLLGEMRRQVAMLKKQAQTASRHSKLVERKRKLELASLFSRRAAARERAAGSTESARALTEQIDGRTRTLARVETQEREQTRALETLEARHEAETETLFGLRNRRELLRQAVAHAEAELQSAAGERRRIDADVAELQEEDRTIRARREALAAEAAPDPDAPREDAGLRARLEQARAELDGAQRRSEEAGAAVTRARGTLAERSATMASQRRELERLREAASARVTKLERARRELEGAEAAVALRAKERDEAELAARASAEAETRATVSLEASQERWEQTRDNAARARAELGERRVERKAASERLRESDVGAARAVLAAGIPGVQGRVADALVVPESHVGAVAGALGHLMEYLVVDGPTAARAVLAFARQRRLAIGCVEQGGEGGPPPPGGLLAHLEVKPWLPRTVCARLAAATLVADIDGAGDSASPILVDADGNCRSVDGFWHSAHPDGGQLARHARLQAQHEALAGAIEAAEAALAQAEERERAASVARQASRAALDASRLARQASERALRDAEQRVLRAGAEQERLAQQLRAASDDDGADAGRREALEQRIDAGNAAINELRAEVDGAEAALEATRGEVARAREAWEAVRDEQARADAERKAREARETQRLRDLEELAKRLERLAGRMARNQTRRAELDALCVRRQMERDANGQEAAQLERTLEVAEREASARTAALTELRHRVTQLSGEARALRRDLGDLRARAERTANEQREAEREIEWIDDAFAQRYDLALTQVEAELADFEAPADGASALRALEAEIESLGRVNHAAVDELTEAEARFEFLAQQKGDLVAAIEDMRAAIDRLDSASRVEFLNTFQDLRDHFERLFKRLFRGGEATLVLSDETDPLSAGVEVFVRPPGKKIRSMTLLSGGEKALTAIAMVFAAFTMKPSPFCILDEVDAPLDDANVDRFVAMIQELAAETQFLVVTHNRSSMEGADMLVGVTMDEPGCSKLVSVGLPGRGRRGEERPEPSQLVADL